MIASLALGNTQEYVLERFDYVVIGSGLNSLIAATLLAKSGNRVSLLERNDCLGGCIRTDDTSLPGFVFDLLSISHVQFITSPADLEATNINLVGGDPYSGHCGLNQQLLFRPLPALRNHETPVRNLYHIGASTHPGPGLGGMSGYLVAKSLI